MSQRTMADLWMSYNHLCAAAMAVCVLAGVATWAQAFMIGVAVSALMAMLHLRISA